MGKHRTMSRLTTTFARSILVGVALSALLGLAACSSDWGGSVRSGSATTTSTATTRRSTTTRPTTTTTRPTTTTTRPTTTTTRPTTTTTTTAPPQGCQPPVTVTAAATLTGCYRSTNPATPTIRIQTTAPVELDHARIEHAGIGVSIEWDGAQLNVHDTTFQKLPAASGAAFPGHRAVYAYGVLRLHFDNNLLIDGDGVYWNDGAGTAIEGSYLRNVVRNVGRYQPATLVQAFQTDKVNVAGLEVAWNKVTNTPLQSDVEDVLSFYQSNGTPAAPFNIHHNLLDGAYPTTLGPGTFNGTGLVLADSNGSYQRAHHNWLVSNTNQGASIPAGNNLEIDHNVVVNDGLANGVATGPDYGNGISLWDNAAYPGAPTNAIAHDNTVGFNRVLSNGTLTRSDYYLPACATGACTNSMAQPITSATEQAARNDWETVRAGAGVTIGPRP
jgi:hypothetical protein